MLHCSDIRGPLSIQPALALMGALEEGGEEDEVGSPDVYLIYRY